VNRTALAPRESRVIAGYGFRESTWIPEQARMSNYRFPIDDRSVASGKAVMSRGEQGKAQQIWTEYWNDMFDSRASAGRRLAVSKRRFASRASNRGATDSPNTRRHSGACSFAEVR
jgi:hypothetical protein